MNHHAFLGVLVVTVVALSCQPKEGSGPDSNTQDTTSTAEATSPDETTSLTSSPTGSSTSTPQSSTSASGGESAASEAGTGTGTVDCLQHTDKAKCEEESADCELLSATEVEIQDQKCVSVASDVGFCMFGGAGGSASPSGWYEKATLRVFSFAAIPLQSPEQWSMCTCGPPSPEACKCTGSQINCP